MKQKYEHIPELRDFGFPIRLATILFTRYINGKMPVLKQSDIIKLMGISAPNFYSHLKWNPSQLQERFDSLGISRFKKGKFVYYELDVQQYQDFLFNIK